MPESIQECAEKFPVIRINEDDLAWGVNLLSAYEIAKMFQIPEQLIGTPNSNLSLARSTLAEKGEGSNA